MACSFFMPTRPSIQLLCIIFSKLREPCYYPRQKKKMESTLFEGQAVENQVFSKKKKRKKGSYSCSWGSHQGVIHGKKAWVWKPLIWWPSHHCYSWLVKIILCIVIYLMISIISTALCLEVNGIRSLIYRMLTSYPTSLSIHFLTRRSSPVMSLIVYMILVADSCASRITPTIVTWK